MCLITYRLLEGVRRVGAQFDLATCRRRVDDNAHSCHVHVGVHAKDDVDDELFRDEPVIHTDAAGRVQHEDDIDIAIAIVCQTDDNEVSVTFCLSQYICLSICFISTTLSKISRK